MSEGHPQVIRSQEYHVVFSELIATAQRRGAVTYQEIAKLIGLPLSGNYMGSRIAGIAGEISTDEHHAGRPMLTSILVNTTGKPGAGFFRLARTLGRLESSDRVDELRYWEAEKKATHDAWKVILSN